MYDETVTILENRKINAHYWKLVFRSRRLARHALPGQFLNIKVDVGPDPFLRRPFSYYRARGDQVEILYEVLGRGSAILARKHAGETLQALGPLGRPFSQHLKAKRRILVGGGVGVPPLVFFAEELAKTKGNRSEPPLFLIGCKAKGNVLPARELSQVKAEVLYTTEDGSHGTKGLVTVLLEKILKRENPKSVFLHTCGPTPMMLAVMRMAKRFGASGEASVEERMACGVGACLGCVVETKTGYETSCVKSPVFSFDELVYR